MLVDCHMHTPLCGHALGNPEDYVRAAADRGIQLITVTCHAPVPGEGMGQEGIRMRKEDLPVYREFVTAAKEAGIKAGVEVLYGIEGEFFRDEAVLSEMRQLTAEEDFDFVLGSLHHQVPAFREYLIRGSTRSDPEIIEDYFDCLGEAAETGLYDSLSHPDVIRMYGTMTGPFEPETHARPIQRALDRIAMTSTCLEINTSGCIKGDYVMHPDPVILKWAVDRGIPFTLGSDAHTPDMVGQHFPACLGELRAVGGREIHYFRKRKRIGIEI